MVRLRALDRDGWRCVKCGKVGHLQVDHIIPLDKPGSSMYALDNLQSLCIKDHIAKTRGENGPVSPEHEAWRDLLAKGLTRQ